MAVRRRITIPAEVAKMNELEGMSISELNNLIQRAEVVRSGKLEEARSAFVQDVRMKAQELGVTLDDLLPTRSFKRGSHGAGSPKSIVAKYSGPNGEVWGGQGRMPKWLKALVDAGQHRDEFLVTPRVA